MNPNLLVAVSVLVWAVVFLCLIAATAVESDVERRWTEAWAIEWESRHGVPIDDLIDRLAGQAARWRTARRLLGFYVLLGLAGLAGVAALEWRGAPLSPPAFRSLMVFLAAITGLVFLPLRVLAEVGQGLVEGMYRQVRAATGEKLVIESRREIAELPRPERPKRVKAPKAAPPAAAK